MRVQREEEVPVKGVLHVGKQPFLAHPQVFWQVAGEQEYIGPSPCQNLRADPGETGVERVFFYREDLQFHFHILRQPVEVSQDLLKILLRDPLFPQGVNTEFVQVVSPSTLKMRVWERGSGETMACGTGACASVAAAISNGYCPAGEDITVRLRGGELTIRVEGSRVWMTGEAVTVFTGTVEI